MSNTDWIVEMLLFTSAVGTIVCTVGTSGGVMWGVRWVLASFALHHGMNAFAGCYMPPDKDKEGRPPV